MIGIVYIVGAGPGDPGLITVKALDCLRRADAVLYDRLIPVELLSHAQRSAALIDVGKMPGRHVHPQAEINALMIAHARRGQVVVRLKGGDPFVFGRGGEEVQALADADIPFEIVPGVSSAIAVPAYAGIPVTHREIANTLTVISGHLCGPDSPAIDWGLIPKNGTLVILMGLQHLAEIVAQLIAHGFSNETPIAVISNGATIEQIVVVGTLFDIIAQAQTISPPATIVVGNVVRLRRRLAWFNPVQCATLGITRCEENASLSNIPK